MTTGMGYRFLLGVSLSGMLCLAPAAMAQAADPSIDLAEEEPEEIVVYAPILQAQERALQEQRLSINRVDVIAADTVGRFPDQNSAAALARLPAVAVQRDQGQERYIQVRGAPNRWTAVKFDGVPIIGVDEGGGTRAFRFDAIPAVILSGIAVNKSLTAALPAEAVVAQIDLRSWSPFEARGLDLQADAGLGWMALGGGQQRQANLRASWSNDSFGVVVGGAHYRRNQTTDNREFVYDANGLPTVLDFRSYLLVRENNGLFGGIGWRPSDAHRLFLNSTYTEFNDDEERNQYVFQLLTAVPGGTRGPESGNLVSVQNRGTLQDGQYRNSNWINTLGGDHAFGEQWSLVWRLNYTETRNSTDLPILLQQANNRLLRPSLSYDLSNRNLPLVTLQRTVAGPTPGSFRAGAFLPAMDQGAYDFFIFLPVVSDVRSESWVGKLDVERRFDQLSVNAGLQYDDRDIAGNVISASNTVLLSLLMPQVGRNLVAANYVTDQRWRSGFPRGFAVNLIDNKRLFQDVGSILGDLEAAGLYNPANNVLPTDLFDIREKLFQAYGQVTLEWDRGAVVAGLRFERLDQTIGGFLRAGTAPPTPLTVENRYNDWFPSINARVDLSEDLVLRGSVQRSTARPSFGEIRVGATISDTSTPGSISGGNPRLKPEYVWGVDAALEYYIPGGGLASVSGFHRWIDNVLYTGRSIVTDETYNTADIDRRGYIFSSTFNGDNGRLYGVEIAYLQQWSFLPTPLDGFGFQGNVAFLGGSFDAPGRQGAPFPGTSDTIVNASIFYEKFGLSARLSYQWRSDWPDTLGGFGVQGELGDEFRKGYENLDLAIRYALTRNVVLFADLNNLTNAKYIVYEDEPRFPVEVEQIGSRFLFGVRLSY